MEGEECSPQPGSGPAEPEKPGMEHEPEETSTVLGQVVSISQTKELTMIPASSYCSLNGEELFCRICHEGAGAGDLLSPCECAGTLAMVHRVCLESWLTASGTTHCELCHFEFALERLPKPLTEWLTTPSMQHQRRTLCGDAICFLFITPLASLSGWLCMQGAVDLYYTNVLEAFGLLVLTLTLFTIYLFWTVVSLRYHLHLFRTWSESNPRVRLQNPRPGHKLQHQLKPTLHLLFKDKGKETMV